MVTTGVVVVAGAVVVVDVVVVVVEEVEGVATVVVAVEAIVVAAGPDSGWSNSTTKPTKPMTAAMRSSRVRFSGPGPPSCSDPRPPGRGPSPAPLGS